MRVQVDGIRNNNNNKSSNNIQIEQMEKTSKRAANIPSKCNTTSIISCISSKLLRNSNSKINRFLTTSRTNLHLLPPSNHLDLFSFLKNINAHNNPLNNL